MVGGFISSQKASVLGMVVQPRDLPSEAFGGDISDKNGNYELILDADTIPLVIPFVYYGMQDIMPIGAKFPRIGKTLGKIKAIPRYGVLATANVALPYALPSISALQFDHYGAQIR